MLTTCTWYLLNGRPMLGQALPAHSSQGAEQVPVAAIPALQEPHGEQQHPCQRVLGMARVRQAQPVASV